MTIFTSTSTSTLDLATHVAICAHNGQVNKHNSEPYIAHVHRVATHVRDRGLDETHQAVAWLHDVLEDTDYTDVELISQFNNEIVTAVLALTKVPGTSNEQYYNALALRPIAARVKISDIIDNFGRNHEITDESTRLRMAHKYSLGLDVLKAFV